ncbi:hypothetical protein GLOIN_2v1470140 [Rhizophagus irregularis DAOM 181602=DAOM 197198]|uniref:Uncharacterized protein n=1 Tax=Rhizophagus irregularis (strain DAOM 181602 / DAOM 197198 / MUCL 43194) TaxID=747089 RepID=A0A2P4QWY4_RHIID|nr:hypothetical protein GLOIN_2v1470140 [Rhizophagus irregularis DAOM 181602=DAOM 197198]POG82166.1 hypothetical protein GLOIN_2v1470140 [Rhizophagus irregularis DAOM 181602=DAOM 197198]|eukprot:XP_025189032.1 hypothetical protein GLOIN_2v1470140 [Rhizophagus irregularis DAOM 181602=DAOM 197198]
MRPHFPFSNYLAGVSGGGKHRQHLELLCNIGQSILFSWKYGDHIGKELDIIRIINLRFERYDQQNQAFRMLDKVILSRGLLLIKVLTEKKISTPKEWLFIQLQMDEYKIRKILVLKHLHAYGKRTGVGKVPGLSAHIVLKLPFLLQNDALWNIDAVIDLTDITPKTRIKRRPRNCASFVQKLILMRESKRRAIRNLGSLSVQIIMRKSKVPQRIKNTFMFQWSSHIELTGKRPELFRINEYSDYLVIIVDDRNMEYVFGPSG